jgi:hypothetical protein
MTRRLASARTWFGWVWAAFFSMAALAAEPALKATSADGRWHIRADGEHLVIEDQRGLEPPRTLPVAALDGSQRSAVAAIEHAALRRSFVVSFRTLPELWEISYDPRAGPIFDGLVHDYRMGEGLAIAGFLHQRRTRLELPLAGIAFDRSQGFVLGQATDATDGRARLHLVQLDIRSTVARFVVDGDPDLSAARALQRRGRSVIEVPDRGGAAATVVDVGAARLAPEVD